MVALGLPVTLHMAPILIFGWLVYMAGAIRSLDGDFVTIVLVKNILLLHLYALNQRLLLSRLRMLGFAILLVYRDVLFGGRLEFTVELLHRPFPVDILVDLRFLGIRRLAKLNRYWYHGRDLNAVHSINIIGYYKKRLYNGK